jgi:hypothetical protein
MGGFEVEEKRMTVIQLGVENGGSDGGRAGEVKTGVKCGRGHRVA